MLIVTILVSIGWMFLLSLFISSNSSGNLDLGDVFVKLLEVLYLFWLGIRELNHTILRFYEFIFCL